MTRLIAHLYGENSLSELHNPDFVRLLALSDTYVRDYIGGQKYQVPTFCEASGRNLRNAFNFAFGRGVDEDLLSSLVPEVYITHGDAGKDLRSLLVNYYVEHVRSIDEDDEWRFILRRVLDFAIDVLGVIMKRNASRARESPAPPRKVPRTDDNASGNARTGSAGRRQRMRSDENGRRMQLTRDRTRDDAGRRRAERRLRPQRHPHAAYSVEQVWK